MLLIHIIARHLNLLFPHLNGNENYPISLSFLLTISSPGSYQKLNEDGMHLIYAVLKNPAWKQAHDLCLCMILDL